MRGLAAIGGRAFYLEGSLSKHRVQLEQLSRSFPSMSRTTLSLQALQPDDANRNSLQYIIERIKDQKGTFLDVTEESLEDEIKQSVEDETVEDEDMNMEEVEEEVEDDKSRRERILKARAEMLKQIR